MIPFRSFNWPMASFFKARCVVYVLALGTVACLGAADHGIKAPALVECGRVAREQMSDFAFEVTNTDSTLARIVEVVSSCSCTNVTLEGAETLKSGDTRKVKGRIKFGHQIGRMEVTLNLRVSDSLGEERILAVPLRANVIAPLVLQQENLHFEDSISSSTTVEKVVTGKRGNAGIVYDEIVALSDFPWLEAKVSAPDRDSFSVAVTLNPKLAPLGHNRTHVRLRLMHEGK